MRLEGGRFVLIGGAGLIGSHTADRLLEEDIGELVIFGSGGRGRMPNLEQALKDPRVRVFEMGGDIRQADILEAALEGADGVFHFAALWLLQCQEFPRSAFDVNLRGTFNVMESCLKAGVKRLVYSSSGAVYGDDMPEGQEDEPPLDSKNFYGASKIAGEAMLTAFHHRYGLDFVGLRYLNTYGPRQNYRGAYVSVIMKMLDAIDRGEGPTILGDGSAAIDFIAVEDCALANLRAMEAEATNRFYDVCTGRRVTLRELAELLLELTGSKLRINYLPSAGASLGRDRIGRPQRAREEIGFSAETPLREGLERLIAWRADDIARRRQSGEP
jgi:UDP-glucose 4-epimerase